MYTHFLPRRVGWNEVYKWLLVKFLVLYVWASSTWVNIFGNKSGNISLLNLYINRPMAYMYNDFEGMVFNAEYNGSVFVRGVTPAVERTGPPFFASLSICWDGYCKLSPNTDAVIEIKQYQWVVQWKWGILFKDLSGFGHNTNTFRIFATYVLYMCRSF